MLRVGSPRGWPTSGLGPGPQPGARRPMAGAPGRGSGPVGARWRPSLPGSTARGLGEEGAQRVRARRGTPGPLFVPGPGPLVQGRGGACSGGWAQALRRGATHIDSHVSQQRCASACGAPVVGLFDGFRVLAWACVLPGHKHWWGLVATTWALRGVAHPAGRPGPASCAAPRALSQRHPRGL